MNIDELYNVTSKNHRPRVSPNLLLHTWLGNPETIYFHGGFDGIIERDIAGETSSLRT